MHQCSTILNFLCQILHHFVTFGPLWTKWFIHAKWYISVFPDGLEEFVILLHGNAGIAFLRISLMLSSVLSSASSCAHQLDDSMGCQSGMPFWGAMIGSKSSNLGAYSSNSYTDSLQCLRTRWQITFQRWVIMLPTGEISASLSGDEKRVKGVYI